MLRRATGRVETLAGQANNNTGRRGFRDGDAQTALFDRPAALAIDPSSGDVFIADAYNHRVRKYDRRTRTVATVVGTGEPGHADGDSLTQATLNWPSGLVVDPASSSLWIADRAASCVRRLDWRTGMVSTVGGVCGESGPPPTKLAAPNGLAMDPAPPEGNGELLIADTGNNLIRALPLNATGAGAPMRVLAGSVHAAPHGFRDGAALSAFFSSPVAIELDPFQRKLFVADYNNGRLRALDLRNETVVTLAGNGSWGFAERPAVFKGLRGLALDPWSGTLYLADAFNSRIRAVHDASTVPAVAQAPAPTPELQGPVSYWESTATERTTRRALAAAAPSSRPTVIIWVGTCGVYHDHFYNGQILQTWINSGNGTAGDAHGQPKWHARLERSYEVFEKLDEMDVAAIVFYSDAGQMSPAQEAALAGWARRGGGVVGLHTAIATFAYSNANTSGFVSLNPTFHDMLNGIFNGHSAYMDFSLNIVDPDDPVTRGVGHFMVTGELYFPRTDPSRSKLLMTAFDVTHAATYPNGYKHAFGDGRVVYLAVGHDRATMHNPSFQRLLTNSLSWVSSLKTDDSGAPGQPTACPDPVAARAMPCGLMASTDSSSSERPSWPGDDAEYQRLCNARGCCFTEDKGCFFIGKPTPTVSTVHLVMSSHLDVGYTAQPQDVINEAFHVHVPRAVGVGAALRARGGPERLRWMTHTYLVSLFLDCPPGMGLRCPSKAAVQNFTAAVKAGDITWHAFPHNAELAASGVGMVQAGLDLTRRVEAKLGQPPSRTVSIRDVPGVTRGAVPLLANLSVPYLSVGANNNPFKANVPPAFVWRDPPSGAEALVLWNDLGYGGETLTKAATSSPPAKAPDADTQFGLKEATVLRLPGLSDALVYAWRGDNQGPPESVEEVLNTFEKARALVPTAQKVIASDLDTFLARVDAAPDVRSNLPVITSDAAEGWVYGVQSDPIKQQRARLFSRAYHVCRQQPGCAQSATAQNFSRLAVKNSEHTWGVTNRYMNACPRKCNGTVCPSHGVGSMQCNPQLAPDANGGVPVDQLNWDNAAFHALSFPEPLRKDNPYHLMVAAFANQRRLSLDAPLEALRADAGDAAAKPLVAAVESGLRELTPRHSRLSGLSSLPLARLKTLAEFVPWASELSISAAGAIDSLRVGGKRWASPTNQLAQLRYQTLDEGDLAEWRSQFLYENGSSVARDYGKPNVSAAQPRHYLEPPNVASAWVRHDGASDSVVIVLALRFRSELHLAYGAPEGGTVELSFGKTEPRIEVRFDLFNKTATRMPEACFVSFNPLYGASDGGWAMDSLGTMIAPQEVADGAAKGLHGIETGVRYAASRSALAIGSPDAALVRWGMPAPFPTPMITPVELGGGASFVLWDNLYNTNYVLWWPFLRPHADIVFRFSVTLKADDGEALTFLNSGVVRRNDTFELISMTRIGGIAGANCMESYAYRPGMSSTNMASVSYEAPGSYPYLYQCTNASRTKVSTCRCGGCNEPGNDYKQFPKGPAMSSVDNCADACTRDSRCKAWT